ncbi:MAG: gamma-glutamyl-gamma-aminobutyrate hydrolase family protein [Bacteroidetes bacterium]|nr:MAG: gamma-glutamyl-gamma-aminobutyrate hydrolase family protein [Bacteroidota bacterium]
MKRIGLSACFFHPDPARPIFKGKRLLYMEQSMSQLCMRHGAMPLLLPKAEGRISVSDVVDSVDALLLQGGSDVAPESYGARPIEDGRWPGDRYRDLYEIELVQACLEAKKPILGICRGHQLLNVALGGSLYQDTETERKGARKHRDPDVYDRLYHELDIKPGSLLAEIYGVDGRVTINSIHHQAIDRLADSLQSEAESLPDGLIEAVRYTGDSFAYGVQWHPEFQRDEETHLLAPGPLFEYFLSQIT